MKVLLPRVADTVLSLSPSPAPSSTREIAVFAQLQLAKQWPVPSGPPPCLAFLEKLCALVGGFFGEPTCVGLSFPLHPIPAQARGREQEEGPGPAGWTL